VEIRGGEGGKDSKLFVHDLFAAYSKYAQALGFRVEVLDSSEGQVTAVVAGQGVGNAFGRESGKHCVQRVPPTEKSGRRQTSLVTVAVLPLPASNKLQLLPEAELEIATQRGSGPGGQHRNKVETAVRITHVPTGLSVYLDGGRSQHQNRVQAHRILSAKVHQHLADQARAAYAERRKAQVGDGGRGDKIRTYNFIDSRAVDHRTGKKTREVHQVIGKGRFDLLL
jgi:peptide chain release factor 1